MASLSRIRQTAQRLSNEIRRSEKGERGWGQFVGPGTQIGWYGTVAGIGLLSRAGIPPPAEARAWVTAKWQRRADDPEAGRYLCQNSRLAIGLLALTGCDLPDVKEVATGLHNELLTRRLADGTWGDWYAQPDERDQQTSLYTTSLALMSLIDFGVSQDALAQGAQSLVAAVEELALEDPKQVLLPLAAAAKVLNSAQRSARLAHMIKHALEGAPGYDESDVLLYQWSYESDAGSVYGRDYLIIPRAFSYLVLASCPHTPLSRLYGVRGVGDLTRHIPTNTEYLFGRGRTSGIATLDQFLIAYGFIRAGKERFEEPGRLVTLTLWLVGRRNIFTRLFLPVSLLSIMAVAAADPMLFTNLPCGTLCLPSPEPYKGPIRIAAVAGMALLGRPGLDFILRYWRRS